METLNPRQFLIFCQDPPVKVSFPTAFPIRQSLKIWEMVWEAYHHGGHIIGGPCKAPWSLTFHLDTCPRLLGAKAHPPKKGPSTPLQSKQGAPFGFQVCNIYKSIKTPSSPIVRSGIGVPSHPIYNWFLGSTFSKISSI